MYLYEIDDCFHHGSYELQRFLRSQDGLIEAEEVVLVASVHNIQGRVQCCDCGQVLHNNCSRHKSQNRSNHIDV